MKLAINGGTPVRSRPFAPWPVFDSEDAEAVSNLLLSGKVNYWTGEECRIFEREFAGWAGARYAVSLANGTLALDLALQVLSVGAGDEVIVTPRSYIASASSVSLCGATPVFADVDAKTGNLDPQSVERCISAATKAIIAVHLGGSPCDIAALANIAATHKLFLIEDCAQAHGTKVGGKMAGSFGDIGCYSFCQDKIMSTGGEGGMIVTDSEDIWSRAWSFKDHGKSFDAVYNRKHSPGFKWLHESIWSNYRMMEMQAILGRRQLKKIENWLASRAENAALLEEFFKKSDLLEVPPVIPNGTHAYYRVYAQLHLDRLKADWTNAKIVEAVLAEGVPCAVGSCGEIYREEVYASAPGSFRMPHRCFNAETLAKTSLAFLVHPGISKSDIHDVTAAVEKVLHAASL